MIRIDRGPEPAELPRARARGLARAVLARRTGKRPDIEGYNLPAVRGRLYERQHSKCVYCERSIGRNGSPIEHFRPKMGADRGDPFPGGGRLIRADRYWWLAWSWSNLFLSCDTCNSATFKGVRFPLKPGSPELDVPDGVLHDAHVCFAVGIECPLLIDPAWDDPLDHMIWLPLDRAAPYQAWRAVHRTERGRFTVQILGLDGRNVDRAGDHIRNNVKHWVDDVHEALATSKVEAAQAIWKRALACLFAPSQLFHAASHDALAYLVPSDLRARAGLVLPRPGAPRPIRNDTGPATPQSAISTSHLGLPEEVILHLLADERSTPELISLICRARSSSLDELASLLELGRQTVRQHCEELVSLGELAVDASMRYVPAPSNPPGLPEANE